MKHAICVFVKTPGLSPIKTRLASSLGEAKTLQFYKNALSTTEKMITKLAHLKSDVHAIWAVAEKAALNNPLWSSWPNFWQGEGSLGDRLAKVEKLGFAEHESVMFFGADSPHVSEKALFEAYRQLESCDVVVGPCEDGGFYLLLTRMPLGEQVWKNVTYSTDNTWAELKKQILKQHPHVRIKEIEVNFDVDTLEEYNRACALLPELLNN